MSIIDYIIPSRFWGILLNFILLFLISEVPILKELCFHKFRFFKKTMEFIFNLTLYSYKTEKVISRLKPVGCSGIYSNIYRLDYVILHLNWNYFKFN